MILLPILFRNNQIGYSPDFNDTDSVYLERPLYVGMHAFHNRLQAIGVNVLVSYDCNTTCREDHA